MKLLRTSRNTSRPLLQRPRIVAGGLTSRRRTSPSTPETFVVAAAGLTAAAAGPAAESGLGVVAGACRWDPLGRSSEPR
jgi:hypothetical protein